MKEYDQIFTPPELAVLMTRQWRRKMSPRIVADYAVGGGELLLAAAKRWPDANVIATDIDPIIINDIRVKFPNWNSGQCDLLTQASRQACRAYTESHGGVDLVLMNPPFSSRGRPRLTVGFFGEEVNCTKALAFLLSALECLAPSGQLVFILPCGALHNVCNRHAWMAIRRRFKISNMIYLGSDVFKGYAASTFLITIVRRGKEHPTHPEVAVTRKMPVRFRVERGTVDIPTCTFSSKRTGLPLIHTTDLGRCLDFSEIRRVADARKEFQPPLVLIPRVGRPKEGKLALILDGPKLALSNCIIAVKCRCKRDAQQVSRFLKMNWPNVRDCYIGTGAKFTTLAKIEELLVASKIFDE